MQDETFREQQRFQDIAIFNIRDGCAPKKSKPNLFIVILVTVFVTVTVVSLGYVAGLKAGLIAAPSEPCCFGALELDFDFNVRSRGA